jgi:leader peptidase (prepilin peptidase) / N-methyltransferase
MIYWASGLFGLAAGSFANVCILRLPQDQSVRFPRSFCPHCGHQLKIVHNIPILSFIMLKGRCFYCRAPISWQYPLIESLMCVLFLFHAWVFKNSLGHLIAADILGFYSLTLSIIDYRHRIIPDELSLSLIVLGICGSFVNPYLSGPPWHKGLESAAAGAGGGLLMLGVAWVGEKIFKREALGGGDIKLIAGTASVLGWQGIVGPLLIGSFSGGVVALVLLLMKKKQLGETLPFGPFLSLGAYITCLFPRLWFHVFGF